MATIDKSLDNISIDWTQVKSFEPVETDTYDAVFTDAKVTDNRAKDGKLLNCEFTIENNDDEDLNGRKLFHRFSLKPNALWALKAFFIEAGADEEDLGADMKLKPLVEDAIGAHFTLSVEKKVNEEKSTADKQAYFNEVKTITAQ